MQRGPEEFRLDDVLLGSEKRQVEALFDPIQFDALFDFANKLLVSKPVEYDPTQQPELSAEARLIAHFGSRGIRSAFELSEGTERLGGSLLRRALREGPPADDDVPDYAASRDIKAAAIRNRIDGPIRYPELYSGQLDRHAIARAELLGDALMDDMFRILGQDAYTMAENMKNAESDEEQMRIAQWLSKRLRTLVDTYEDEANVDLVATYRDSPQVLSKGFSYHPVRLSGKVIGTYPNHQLSPTCLGVSIAAAGFMKRAGVDFMHGGVMSSRADQRIQHAVSLMHLLPQLAHSIYDVSIPEKFQKRTKEGLDYLLATAATDIGYHHCIYLRLKSGAWMQLDPSFRQTIDMNFDDTNTRLSTTYSFLQEMHEAAPNLEVTTELESFKSLASRFQAMLGAIDTTTLPSQDTATTFIEDLPHNGESLTTVLYDTFAAPAFSIENITTESEKNSLKYILAFFDTYLPHDQEMVLRDSFLSVLDTYILDGMPLDEYLLRCKSDAAFLERAANDLRCAPFMMMSALSMNLIHEDLSSFGVHTHVELGLPATRIGLSALGDVAQFHDISPSPTFWLSNWTSLQANTEAFYLGYSSPNQKTILMNNLGGLLERELLYSTSYGKIALIQSEFNLGRDQEDGEG